MTETKRVMKRNRAFSLRSLFVVVFAIACGLAFYSYEFHRQQKINASIFKLRDAGAIVYVNDSQMQATSVSPPKQISLLSLLTTSSTINQGVELSSPQLSAEDLRGLVPCLRCQVGPYSKRTGEDHVYVYLKGNPNVRPKDVAEMRKALPNCKFPRCKDPLPSHTIKQITVGMSKEQVIQTIGTIRYDQLDDQSGDKENRIRNLGSCTTAYENAQGLEAWTYFADEDCIRLLGIGFDANQNVNEVWVDYGIAKDRGLTEIIPVIGGL